ncbi:V-type ATP synthase subunit F [Candidatus Micrarchaeota archaeon]|nr:V-type ATP synthase subunit F [Candidatus Micrarchaeota archaeon]
MKTGIMVLGDAPLVTGFQLAGLENSLVVTHNTFQKELESILEKKEFGVIVVNENMLSTIDWRLKKKLDSIAFPVIVPIPDIREKSSEGDEIKNLIKRALGFDLSSKK